VLSVKPDSCNRFGVMADNELVCFAVELVHLHKPECVEEEELCKNNEVYEWRCVGG